VADDDESWLAPAAAEQEEAAEATLYSVQGGQSPLTSDLLWLWPPEDNLLLLAKGSDMPTRQEQAAAARAAGARAKQARQARLTVQQQMAEAGKLRVLCLHGYGQDGETFRAKSGSVRKDLKKFVEWTFVTSPHLIDPSAPTMVGHPDHQPGVDGAPPGRFWWDFTVETRTMLGLDESIAFVTRVCEEQGPFDGVLGFSQGAGFAALLLAKMQRGELSPAVAFRFGG
jgi:hypothetical protein